MTWSDWLGIAALAVAVIGTVWLRAWVRIDAKKGRAEVAEAYRHLAASARAAGFPKDADEWERIAAELEAK